MEPTSFSYQIIAQGFVALLNLVMVFTLGINYLSSRKSYLRWATAAGLLEACRLIPNISLLWAPQSALLIIGSMAIQYLATLVLLAALLCYRARADRRYSLWAGLFLLVGIVNFAFLTANGIPTNTSVWLLHTAPLSVVTTLVLWHAWRMTGQLSISKAFLLTTIAFLLLLRLIVPFTQDENLFFLLYYIETLTFPIVLAAINVFAVEMANQQIKQLLDSREQSEQDLKFIIDNSPDVILIADKIGLIKSWNKPGETLFGYAATQVIDKMHMDDLFADNHWQRKADESEEFTTRIEHVKGAVVTVAVRMRPVTQENSSHSIFVIKALGQEQSDIASEHGGEAGSPQA